MEELLHYSSSSSETTDSTECSNHSNHFPTTLQRKELENPDNFPSAKHTHDTTTRHHFERRQPHIPGNWSGYLYVSLQSHSSTPTPIQAMNQLHLRRLNQWARWEIRKCQRVLQQQEEPVVVVPHISMEDSDSDDSSEEDDATCDDLHISLSRPFTLQQHSLSSFTSELTTRLQFLPAFTIAFPLSPLESSNDHPSISPYLDLLVNDERTRSFLVLPAHSSSCAPIHHLIHAVNDILRKYGQMQYHECPKVHVSVASMQGDVRSLWNQNVVRGSEDGSEEVVTHETFVSFHVECVHCQFGSTKNIVVPLQGGKDSCGGY